jgi:hypothetical protein
MRSISIIMRFVINSLAFAAGVYAQSTAYTDANTGIDFQQYADTTGVSFGIAIPETPASDFIGQMVRTMLLNPVGYFADYVCRCTLPTAQDMEVFPWNLL